MVPTCHTLLLDPFSPLLEEPRDSDAGGHWGKAQTEFRQAEVETSVQATRSLTGLEVVPQGLGMAQLPGPISPAWPARCFEIKRKYSP